MKHLIKSTALLTTSNVLTKVTAMLFFVILARAMSVSDYGLFRYLITLSMVFAIAFTGFPTALIKFIGEDKSNKKRTAEYLANSFLIMLVIFLVLIVVILISQSNKFYLSLLLFAVLIDTLYLGFVRGLLNYVKLAGFKLVENIIQLAILITSFFLLRQINFSFAIIFFSLSPFLSLIIFEIIKPELKFIFNISKDKINQIIKYAIPVTLGSVGWTIMFAINTIFIKYFYNTEQIGYYSVGETIVQVFTFIPAAIATITLPKVAGLKDKSKIINPLKLAVFGTLTISTVGLILLVIFKKFLLILVFGEKYLPTLKVILPLSIGQILISIHLIYGVVWQGLNKPLIPSIIIFIGCIINIVLSFILIPIYSINGAAIALLVTSLVVLVITVFQFNRELR